MKSFAKKRVFVLKNYKYLHEVKFAKHFFVFNNMQAK